MLRSRLIERKVSFKVSICEKIIQMNMNRPSVSVESMTMGSGAAFGGDRLQELGVLINQVASKRVQSQRSVEAVIKARERAMLEKKLSSSTKSKLKGYYRSAIEDCGQEEDSLRKSLSIIQDIQTASWAKTSTQRADRPQGALRRGAQMQLLRMWAMQLPLWVPTGSEKPPPLCGAIPAEPNYVAKVEDMVAALVKNTDSTEGTEEDENWILAKVSHYNPTTCKYEVDDIDVEGRERHLVSRRRVIPLPLLRANPITHPEAIFPKGTLVNALYPQTTCFYRALVDEIPLGPQEEYSVLFEDTNYPEGYSPAMHVAQRYVICCKDQRKR